jgi:hypothetical protein
MKKLNLKQPKYIFPLVILLPIVFLAYEISQFTKGSDDPKKGVVTDNINMSLPDAANEEMGNKMTEMNKHFSEDGAYTAIGALGDDKEEADSTMSGYSESELNDIDAENAKRTRKQKELEDLERSLAESRKHINSYGYDGGSGYGGGGGYGGRGAGSRNGRNAEMDDYARELEEIQQRSLERQRVLERTFGADEEEKERKAEEERKRLAEERKKNEVKPEVVKKADDASASMFNTINDQQAADAPLIKAMIDKTTKAHEGTRLRFKLLDDVIIKDVRLKKGTYLYGIVTGFGQQRVMASITSILVGDKFIKVSLSVFDNDGMEGFYVPESAFRDMMKDAGAQAMQSNISLDGGYGGGLSGEAVALHALQNMYQSASTAISGNIRKNKARIKYNTIVYLINKDAQKD